jgi:hypothetical protein
VIGVNRPRLVTLPADLLMKAGVVLTKFTPETSTLLLLFPALATMLVLQHCTIAIELEIAMISIK